VQRVLCFVKKCISVSIIATLWRFTPNQNPSQVCSQVNLSDKVTKAVVELIHEYLTTVGENFRYAAIKIESETRTMTKAKGLDMMRKEYCALSKSASR